MPPSLKKYRSYPKTYCCKFSVLKSEYVHLNRQIDHTPWTTLYYCLEFGLRNFILISSSNFSSAMYRKIISVSELYWNELIQNLIQPAQLCRVKIYILDLDRSQSHLLWMVPLYALIKFVRRTDCWMSKRWLQRD